MLNGSHDHAAIIIERMFARAQSAVRILTRRFDPRVYCEPATLRSANLMLGDRSRTIKILVEDIQSTAPNKNDYFDKFPKRGNIEIREIPKGLREAISVNFALMDELGYRFEKDQTGATAVVSFGEMTLVPRLKSLFDSVWDRSRVVVSPQDVDSKVLA